MIALVCAWGGDILIGPTGDIATASVEEEVEHRIVRRLLTNLNDYAWHPQYGAGLGSYVGESISPQSIESAILYHIQYEPLVRSNPAPKVVDCHFPDQSFSNSTITIQYNTVNSSVGVSTRVGLHLQP